MHNITHTTSADIHTEIEDMRMSASTGPHFTRRRALLWLPAAAGILIMPRAWALSLADISNQDAIAGLKGALSSSTAAAIGKLGVDGGFWNNPKVKIPLPEYLEKASGIMNAMGMRKQLDDLHEQINHAAEKAVVEAKPIFVNAVKAMSVQDAKGIISGGNTSGTEFFKNKTTDTLKQKFLPVVTAVTQRIGLAQKYNELAARGSQFGLVRGDNAKVETYVTAKSLDGLFTMMADEEKAIRANPVAAGSSIVSKVFGALR
ncbi:MAG: hypothetical protein JWN73_2108 [Betaproteobacteria bacterium]|nr:hypothetical protein [Betaproteobacteria bacterium]